MSSTPTIEKSRSARRPRLSMALMKPGASSPSPAQYPKTEDQSFAPRALRHGIAVTTLTLACSRYPLRATGPRVELRRTDTFFAYYHQPVEVLHVSPGNPGLHQPGTTSTDAAVVVSIEVSDW